MERPKLILGIGRLAKGRSQSVLWSILLSQLLYRYFCPCFPRSRCVRILSNQPVGDPLSDVHMYTCVVRRLSLGNRIDCGDSSATSPVPISDRKSTKPHAAASLPPSCNASRYWNNGKGNSQFPKRFEAANKLSQLQPAKSNA